MNNGTYMHLPNTRKPKLCVWSDLNVNDTEKILKCGNTTETRNLLQNIFSLEETPRDQVLIDLYMHLIIFVKLQRFSKEQASTFFSIVKQTHEVCVSTPFGNVEECFSFFRELVLLHAVHRPPWSLKIFTSDQVETITTHVINTYFRHFKLYKYVFTPKVKLDISFQYSGLAPSPVPLPEEGSESDLKIQADEDGIETPTAPDESEEVAEEPSEVAETEASNELENIVRKAVAAQLKQMHTTIEHQLEDTDKIINEKISAMESGKSPRSKSGKRSPKVSAKGKRK